MRHEGGATSRAPYREGHPRFRFVHHGWLGGLTMVTGRRLGRGLAVVVVALVLASCGTSAPLWVPRLTWQEVRLPLNPPGRYEPAMAYDAATNQVVLFGGARDITFHLLGDTWTWNGTTWTEQHPAQSPPPMYGSKMAYDAATHQLVLFGGGVSKKLPSHHPSNMPIPARGVTNTWTWNGNTWAELHPKVSPPPLMLGVDMVYDAATREIVLLTNGPFPYRTTETWTWNGTTWTEQHPPVSPPDISYVGGHFTMAYDSATRQVVLYDNVYIPRRPHIIDETWTWNGVIWTEQHPPVSPTFREGGTLVETPSPGILMLTGGAIEGNPKNPRIWFWNGRTWYGVAPPRTGLPSPIYATYDDASRTIVIQEDYLTSTGTMMAHTWLVKLAAGASRQ